MSRFSDDEKDAILREAFATVERTVELATVRKMIDDDHEAEMRAKNGPLVVETKMQRDIREIEERDAQWERERKRDKRMSEQEHRQWDKAIAEASALDRVHGLEAQVLEAVRCINTLCEGLEVELNRYSAENRDLKTKQAELEIKLPS
jgi:hypothetical protein